MVVVGIFFGAFFLTVILFTLKSWEVSRGRVLGAGTRARGDAQALRLKSGLEWLGDEIEKIPPTLVLLSRYGVHVFALGAARFSRSLESNAYRLADRVSHKRNFEKRETRSQFLKDVTEHKNGKGLPTKDVESLE